MEEIHKLEVVELEENLRDQVRLQSEVWHLHRKLLKPPVQCCSSSSKQLQSFQMIKEQLRGRKHQF